MLFATDATAMTRDIDPQSDAISLIFDASNVSRNLRGDRIFARGEVRPYRRAARFSAPSTQLRYQKSAACRKCGVPPP